MSKHCARWRRAFSFIEKGSVEQTHKTRHGPHVGPTHVGPTCRRGAEKQL